MGRVRGRTDRQLDAHYLNMQSFTGSRLALREKLDAAGYSDLSWGTKKPWSPVKILFFRGIAIQAREAARERLGRDTS